MIFCARRFTAREAADVGLINKCVPQAKLREETLKWCETMKGHSALTIRMTKRSLNFESDNLYSSWQHGMELLAHVWGSEEAQEGMNAFLAGRAPDFQQFRMRDKKELERYLAGYERDENAPPDMRGTSGGVLAGTGRRDPGARKGVAAKAARGRRKSAKV